MGGGGPTGLGTIPKKIAISFLLPWVKRIGTSAWAWLPIESGGHILVNGTEGARLDKSAYVRGLWYAGVSVMVAAAF